MTLSDYRALKAGLELIADITSKINSNEGVRKQIQGKIDGYKTQITQVKIEIRSNMRELESAQTENLRRLNAAFEQQYPGINATEANARSMKRKFKNEKKKALKNLPKPTIPDTTNEIRLQWFLIFFFLFVAPLLLTAYWLDGPPVSSFVCSDGDEIPSLYVRDGTEDCADGSDEGRLSYEQVDVGQWWGLQFKFAFFLICLLLPMVGSGFAFLQRLDQDPLTFTIGGSIYHKSLGKYETESKLIREDYDKKVKVAHDLLDQHQLIQNLQSKLSKQQEKLGKTQGLLKESSAELTIESGRMQELYGLLDDAHSSIAHLIP